VGSFNFTGDAELPILSKANTAWWGVCCAISPLEFTSKDSFPMGNQPLYAVGLIKRAKQDGCKKTNAVIIQGAEAFIIAAADTVMNRPSRELLAEFYPGVPLRDGVGEFDTLLGIDKARRLLGYAPRYSWREHVG